MNLIRFVGLRIDNETQGKDGVYFGRGTREIATVRNILLGNELVYDADTMDMLISAVADPLLVSKEGISTKLDAIALLICIAVKYPEDYTRNQGVYEKLFEQQKAIEIADNSIISSNIDGISLKIGLQLLYTTMGKEMYAEILELMPYIQGDIATTIVVTHLIVEYLENSDDEWRQLSFRMFYSRSILNIQISDGMLHAFFLPCLAIRRIVAS